MERREDNQLRRYVADLSRFSGSRLPLAAALMVVVGLLEGIGLMLLVPLLALVGLGAGEGEAPPPAVVLERLLDGLGLGVSLPSLLGLFLALIGLKLLLTRERELRTAALRLAFTDHLRNRLYRRIAYSEWLFFSATRAAEFSHALTQEVQRIGQGTFNLLQLATTAALAAAYLVAAFALSIPLTAAALGCGVVLLLPMRRLQRRSVGLGRRMSGGQRRLMAAAGELLGGMKAAKAHGAEARHVEQFARHAARQRAAQLDFQRLSAGIRAWYQWGAAFALALLVWGAVEWLRLPAAELVVLIAIFARLAPMLSTLQQSYQQVLHMLPAYAAFSELERRCLDAAEPELPSGIEPPPFTREIRLEGVCFRYRKEHPEPVLDGVELTLPVRTTLALVGPSGGGKSTLADLLAGLLAADAGRVTVDGTPVEGASRRAWRGRVAYVPQETFLLHDTVRANLRWAAPEADDRALRRALRQAAAETFVDRLPEGLDTVVGERGVRLSGGERQRIALARALLQKPELLILDEATSALDRENERAIQAALDALHGDLTLVIIAHRLSTVRHADRIVVLDRGRVVESGDWETLAGRPGGRLAAMLHEGGGDGPI